MTEQTPGATASSDAAQLPVIDVTFDFRSDTPPGKDPDTYSPTLRRYHRILWSKTLPGGAMFELGAGNSRSYLPHDSDLGRFFLASDTIVSSYRKRRAEFYGAIPENENEEFHRLGYTIGGSIVFPGNRVDGRQTINQRRGTHHLIHDRFDLTLECLRLFYEGQPSPLSQTITIYEDFFALFEDFDGYVEYFLLQDLVTNSEVDFFLPFDDFGPSPLPDKMDDYIEYREKAMTFVKARNRRIDALYGLTAPVHY